MHEIPKPESLQARGGFWLELADQEIHVSLEDGVDRNATKAHLAYQVDDLEFWRSKLSHAGLQILEGVPIPGFERFETRDPFGNRLEFILKLERDWLELQDELSYGYSLTPPDSAPPTKTCWNA